MPPRSSRGWSNLLHSSKPWSLRVRRCASAAPLSCRR
jgi:hypothetical protein